MRRPVLQTAFREVMRLAARLVATICFRFRVHGMANYPKEDGFLICSNHQSHLDPVIVGLACPRSANTLGRETLTNFKPFGALLYYLDLIAIDREGGGLAGLKETMRRLRLKETVVMFPEGTRTRDGELQPIKMGFATIARKVKAPILPMAFDGAFQSMPRSSWLIRPGRIHVVIGKPIFESEYREMTDEELGEWLSARITECFAEARRRRNSAI
jgi:1-acyl-sn-glycerol-3-phosphate acyltransferase